jgi:hypothetical protein
VVGQDRAIRLLTIAIFARGHVMLEGDVGAAVGLFLVVGSALTRCPPLPLRVGPARSGRSAAARFEREIAKAVVGQDRAIRLLTIAIFARGHVLVVGSALTRCPPLPLRVGPARSGRSGRIPDRSEIRRREADPQRISSPNPKELNKQADSIKQMEERNKKRVENFKKTGKFEYDVAKISAN